MDFDKSITASLEVADEANSIAMMSSALTWFRYAPTNAREALTQAWQFFAFAQFEAALATLTQIPETAEAGALRRGCYEHLARWALETGDLARAEWAAEQHLREDSSAFQAWAVRGEVASLRGDDAAAIEGFNRALGTLPREYAATEEQAREVARLLYLRVAALVRLRRYPEAMEQWRVAAERDAENSDLWYLGALCLAQLGQVGEARRLCQRALQLDARHLDASKLKRQLEATSHKPVV